MNQRDNVDRHLGQPELMPVSVYRDPHKVTAWGYPTVLFDKKSRKWRMLYLGWTSLHHDKTLSQLTGKALRLEIEMTSARLYALRGQFALMTGGEVRRYESDGTLPQERPGF